MFSTFQTMEMFETLRTRGHPVVLESSLAATSHQGIPTYLVHNNTGQEFLMQESGRTPLRELIRMAVIHHPEPVTLDSVEIQRRVGLLTPDITIKEPMPDEDLEGLACPTDFMTGTWHFSNARALCQGVTLNVMGYPTQGQLRYFTERQRQGSGEPEHWRLLKTVVARMPLLLEPDELKASMASAPRAGLVQLSEKLKQKTDVRAKAMLEDAISQGRAPRPYTSTVYRRTAPLLKNSEESMQVPVASTLPIILLSDEDITSREKHSLSLALERQDHGYLAVDDVMRNPFALNTRPENPQAKLIALQYESSGPKPAVEGQIMACSQELRITLTVTQGTRNQERLSLPADLLASGDNAWEGHVAYNPAVLSPKQLEKTLLRADWDPQHKEDCASPRSQFEAIQDEIQRQIAAGTIGAAAALQLELTKAADRLHVQTPGVASQVQATSANGEFTITFNGRNGRQPA